MGVEELEDGTGPIPSLLQGDLHLLHSLVVGVPRDHLANLLKQVSDLVPALHQQQVLLLLAVPVNLDTGDWVVAS